jgi:predicted adenylyl cyclase CyaB
MSKASNLEQKFRCNDIKNIIFLCEASGFRFHARINQEDIYLDSRAGSRLKIRLIDGREPELILYARPEVNGPRKSDYFRLPLGGGNKEMIKALTSAIGVIGRVKKERTVFYDGTVRINIDRVRKLGSFVELEAELDRGARKDRALRDLKATRSALGLSGKDALSCSYIDLFAGKKPRSSSSKRLGSPVD